MQVIHFTAGATDPVQGFSGHGVRLVSLADGAGADETYVSCLHFEPGAWIADPPFVRDSAVLLVHGAAMITDGKTGMRLELTAGVGVVLNADDRFRLESNDGAVIIAVESERLDATEHGRSTPERIMGQMWPGETVVAHRRTLLSVVRWIYYRVRWWPKRRRLDRTDGSGWSAPSGETLVETILPGRRRDRTRPP